MCAKAIAKSTEKAVFSTDDLFPDNFISAGIATPLISAAKLVKASFNYDSDAF